MPRDLRCPAAAVVSSAAAGLQSSCCTQRGRTLQPFQVCNACMQRWLQRLAPGEPSGATDRFGTAVRASAPCHVGFFRRCHSTTRACPSASGRSEPGTWRPTTWQVRETHLALVGDLVGGLVGNDSPAAATRDKAPCRCVARFWDCARIAHAAWLPLLFSFFLVSVAHPCRGRVESE